MNAKTYNSQSDKDDFNAMKHEVEKLKLKQQINDLKSTINNTNNQPNKIRSKIKSNDNYFSSTLKRIVQMFSPEYVVSNIIAIGIIFGILSFLNMKAGGFYFTRHCVFVTNCLLFVAAYQIIKSSNKSLLLPSMALLGSILVPMTIGHHIPFLMHGYWYYHCLMVVGIIGCVRSAINIS